MLGAAPRRRLHVRRMVVGHRVARLTKPNRSRSLEEARSEPESEPELEPELEPSLEAALARARTGTGAATPAERAGSPAGNEWQVRSCIAAEGHARGMVRRKAQVDSGPRGYLEQERRSCTVGTGFVARRAAGATSRQMSAPAGIVGVDSRTPTYSRSGIFDAAATPLIFAGAATLATAALGAGLGLVSKPGFFALAGAAGLVFLAIAIAAPRLAFVAALFALAGYLPDTLLHSGMISQLLLVVVLAAVLIRRAVQRRIAGDAAIALGIPRVARGVRDLDIAGRGRSDRVRRRSLTSRDSPCSSC